MLTPFQTGSAAMLAAGTYARTDREALAWAQLERVERLVAAAREDVVGRLLGQGHSWAAVAEVLGESRTTLLRQYRGVPMGETLAAELDADDDQVDDVDEDDQVEDAGPRVALVEVPDQRTPEQDGHASWVRHLDQTNTCAGCGAVRPARSEARMGSPAAVAAGEARRAWWREHHGCPVPAAAG
jgi:hypothetical protein